MEVFAPPANIDSSWKGVQSVIRVTRSGERDGKSYSTLGYYLSSLPPKSNRIAKVIRGHWQVENRLHWVKDVIFDEDKSPQRAGMRRLICQSSRLGYFLYLGLMVLTQ